MRHSLRDGFIIIFIASVMVFFYSLWDIIFQKNAKIISMTLYFTLLNIILILYYQYMYQRQRNNESVHVFKKTLEGGLFHFQCPHCNGFFAIKESMYKTHGQTIITCPDCGKLGLIKPSPPIVYADIPENKSIDAKFRCLYCGEGLKLWAEGTEIYPFLKVLSCPFCGVNKPLEKVNLQYGEY
jgi:transcription elongation factor Elf1